MAYSCDDGGGDDGGGGGNGCLNDICFHSHSYSSLGIAGSIDRISSGHRGQQLSRWKGTFCSRAHPTLG